MSHSVQMPALGESVTEGTITRWLKKEGDTVAEDEPLLEVSTDKVDTEIPAPYAGVLEKILVQEDETVEVGANLAIIGDGSTATDGAPAPATDAAPVAPAAPASTPAADSAPAPTGSGDGAPSAPPADAVAPVAAPVAPQPAGDVSGTEVTMPEMGESVTEGTVTRWLKQIGDPIAEDEPIVEIATDKVDTEVPSPVAGTLLRILAAEDDTVEVGTPIAIVGTEIPATHTPAVPDAAAVPAPEITPAEPVATAMPEVSPAAETAAPAPTAPAPATTAAPTPAAPAPTAPGRSGGYVTPVVRKLAADHGVELSTIIGTGVGGRIRREDVLAAAARPATEPTAPLPPAAKPTPAVATVPPTAPAVVAPVAAAPVAAAPVAAAVGAAVVGAVAQTTTIIEMDASRVIALRDRAQAAFTTREGAALTALPFFLKAAVEAAKAHPSVNSSLSAAGITHHAEVNLGVTIDTDRGQIIPVIHRADELNVTGLARRVADLTVRTRAGAVLPGELSGATLTVTSSAAVGAMIETPSVSAPQVATLAVGAIIKRPVVVSDLEGNDVIAVRSMVTVALSFDQRAVDASDAGRYLASIKHRIEDGDFTADLGM